MIRNRTTAAGAALGRELARLVDEAEPRARLIEPAIPPRCASCAFRVGPHVANGSEATLGDALKCVLENVEFQCHEPARAGQPCSGWLMLQLAHPSASGSVPWGFSDEVWARRDPHNTDALARREGHDGPPLGSLADAEAPVAARHDHHGHALAQARFATGDAVVACPSAGEGATEMVSPLLGTERRSPTTKPAPEYARRDARPLDARSTP